jgi:hypothetical protein
VPGIHNCARQKRELLSSQIKKGALDGDFSEANLGLHVTFKRANSKAFCRSYNGRERTAT